jgi:FtsH-binding integral membrane protein
VTIQYLPWKKLRGLVIRKIFNYVGLQVGWFACAYGAAEEMAWLGPLLVLFYLGLHLFWSPRRAEELRFILLVGAIGLVVDSVKKVTGLMIYAGDIPISWLAPPWVTAMWLLFSTSLNGSLSWLKGRYLLAVILGAVFGPLSYVTGMRLGAAEFHYDFWITVGVLAVVWGLVVPALVWFSKKMVDEGEARTVRP